MGQQQQRNTQNTLGIQQQKHKNTHTNNNLNHKGAQER